MEYHFISGLPRAGSSLFAAILRQNPAFHAGIMSPVGRIVAESLRSMTDNEAVDFISNRQRSDMLRGIVSGYYRSSVTGAVTFDNNRRWCANVGLLGKLYPDCKIFCCLRSPAAIADSFERLFQQAPLNLSVIYGSTPGMTVYERVNAILKPTGVLGFALDAVRSAFYGPDHERLVCISYDDLCRYPGDIMQEVHSAIGAPSFAYDFKKIDPIPGTERFDQQLHTPGLHDLKPEVVYSPRRSILPPDVLEAMPRAFWQVDEQVKEAATLAQ